MHNLKEHFLTVKWELFLLPCNDLPSYRGKRHVVIQDETAS